MADAAAVRLCIDKLEQNAQKESAAAKQHFADLCRLLGVPTPNDPGSDPEIYCFEKSLIKTGGKVGFVDVWSKDRFAWEYKGKRKYATLDQAVFDAYEWPHDLSDDEILARLGKQGGGARPEQTIL